MNIDRIGIVTLVAVVAILLSVVSYVLPGRPGIQGVPGEIGLSGVQGSAGPPGPQGDQGTSGPKGDVGPQGVQGEKGDSGSTIRETILPTAFVLAGLSSPNSATWRGGSITIIGTAFFHDPEIWLYDSSGKWFMLGQALRNPNNNTFSFEGLVPNDVRIGVCEIAAKAPDGRTTYVTFPVLVAH